MFINITKVLNNRTLKPDDTQIYIDDQSNNGTYKLNKVCVEEITYYTDDKSKSITTYRIILIV